MFEQIDEADTQDELDAKERYWIQYYNSTDKNYGYNLDTGGRGGGEKSDETKKKIGITTKEKWANPETAQKMREGLLKGAETMKRNAKKYPFTCPVCGKILYLEKWEAERRKFCSLGCAAKSGAGRKGVERSAFLAHERNVERKKAVRQDIDNWVIQNADLVLNCPKNKIRTTLSDLINMIKEKYGIKDWRSIFICFDDTKNMKTLLDRLQEVAYISKENVRRAGLN